MSIYHVSGSVSCHAVSSRLFLWYSFTALPALSPLFSALPSCVMLSVWLWRLQRLTRVCHLDSAAVVRLYKAVRWPIVNGAAGLCDDTSNAVGWLLRSPTSEVGHLAYNSGRFVCVSRVSPLKCVSPYCTRLTSFCVRWLLCTCVEQIVRASVLWL